MCFRLRVFFNLLNTIQYTDCAPKSPDRTTCKLPLTRNTTRDGARSALQIVSGTGEGQLSTVIIVVQHCWFRDL